MLARVSDPISLRQQLARRLRCETGLSIDFLQVSSNQVHADSNGTYLSGRPCFPSFLQKQESADLSLC